MSEALKEAMPVAQPRPAVAKRMAIEKKDLGKEGSLRYAVMYYVMGENYAQALVELQQYLEQDFEYPNYKEKIERYIEHSIGLVSAIQSKKEFSNHSGLSSAKQEQIVGKIGEHYQDLLVTLKRTEKIHLELKLSDMRSTAIVLRSFMYGTCAILFAAFFLELHGGLAQSSSIVFDEFVGRLTDWLLALIF